MVNIIVDQECDSDEFWNEIFALERTGNIDAHTIVMANMHPVAVSADDAARIKTLCESIPGWHSPDAPDFAAHPIIFDEDVVD